MLYKFYFMDSMNFLNKKYVSSYQQPLSQSRSSRSFLPTHQFPPTAPQPPHSPSTLSNQNSSSLLSNHCSLHPQQLVRHMCVDCIELLCSECIGSHISSHKDSSSFPTIQTLKQIKNDMHVKLSDMMQSMFDEQHHPKNITSNVDKIRTQSSGRIDNLRKQMVESIDEWIGRLKGSVLNNVGYQEIKVIKEQMYGLQQQLNGLNNCLSQTNVSAQTIKKAYQIDGERLHNCYLEMIEKYQTISDTMKVQIEIDYETFLKGLEQSIIIKIGSKNIRIQNQLKQENTKSVKSYNNLPLQINQAKKEKEIEKEIQIEKENIINAKMSEPMNDLEKSVDDETQLIPYLFKIPSGSTILSHFQPKGPIGNQIKQYNLPNVSSYPLNSVQLLPDSMVVISGGMISEEKKSTKIQIFDYIDGTLITQSHFRYGRSSHQTVPYGERIFFIGGFTSQQGECKDIEYLTGEGLVMAPTQCKWGGPNLSIIHNNKSVFKVTEGCVETMDLQTLVWNQITTDIPFTLTKGMQIENWGGNILIFGDGNSYYQWNENQSKFQMFQSSVKLGNCCCSTLNKRKLYAWIENQKSLAVFDGEKWSIYDNCNF